ncbi:MerR family transcriptional regulator [Paenibacillus validus]|uniref:MerR family transcriptional regulator n=1 Tax=Paenibacillus validus TaxID=44253 RepID=A0A7X2Z825_9BACL|nr:MULTISPECIES: MerR family transcriptional regulator [Paenibacillus]MED4603646.1 MerR family transcriptional regulator [Paenibacillus validus]MED4609762.1 MerR family transcriptional regulator [Paenibacillus validus]MUG69470.1 MerR family transcriptional regulator [Paenibacillus validus]
MLTVGEAAERLGITAYTLRYYEKIRLLPEPARRGPGKARLYSEEDLRFIRFLLSLKDTGMSLAHIAIFVKDGCLLDRAPSGNEDLTDAVTNRLDILQQHYTELEAQQAKLSEIMALTREKIEFYSDVLISRGEKFRGSGEQHLN